MRSASGMEYIVLKTFIFYIGYLETSLNNKWLSLISIDHLLIKISMFMNYQCQLSFILYSHIFLHKRNYLAIWTNEWLSNFPGAKVHNIEVTCFNHKPQWIIPDGMDCRFRKPFHFEQMWMLDKGCSDTIEAVWKERINEPSATQVPRKVDICGEELTWWSKKCFGSFCQDLEQKKKHLQWVEKNCKPGRRH